MKDKFGYFIRDSFGCFGGTVGLSIKNLDGTGIEWDYIASRNADRWHGDKNLALAEIQMLEELNAFAQIPGLSWELVYANRKDFPVYPKDNGLPSLLFLHKDIPVGFITKHRKAVREIWKRYKTIFSEIEIIFREKKLAG